MIIAVDGPAAAGKGTIARALAQHFKFHFLDTGTLYRRVGLALLKSHTDPHDAVAATATAQSLNTQKFNDAESDLPPAAMPAPHRWYNWLHQ